MLHADSCCAALLPLHLADAFIRRLQLKTFDHTANPYIGVAALIAAGMCGACVCEKTAQGENWQRLLLLPLAGAAAVPAV